MNKCVECGHESDDEVTCYTSRQIAGTQVVTCHHWYCSKCNRSWYLFGEKEDKRQDEATSFNFGGG